MATRCTPRIEAAGFPGRTEAVLARERNLYPGMVMALLGSPKGRPTGAEDKLTTKLLDEGFGSRERVKQQAAAFLAGRCEPVDDATAAARLTEHCRSMVDGVDVGAVGSRAWSYVEAGMSLALRGEADEGRAALEALAHHEPAKTGLEPHAAAYLAQLGDPGGWPVVTAALDDDADPVLRLRAARLVISFLPYEGQVVEGERIDLRRSLAALARDEDEYVARDIPDLLTELDLVEGGRP